VEGDEEVFKYSSHKWMVERVGDRANGSFGEDPVVWRSVLVGGETSAEGPPGLLYAEYGNGECWAVSALCLAFWQTRKKQMWEQ
jgi:hypothetical protein